MMDLRKLLNLSGVLVVVVSALLPIASCAESHNSGSVSSVSLYDLLTRPKLYDGRLIQVKGFVCLNEDPGLFVSYRECDQRNPSVGIGLLVNDEVRIKRESNDSGRYGYVTGVFHFLSQNSVSLDTTLGSANMSVEKIATTDSPYEWSYKVTKPLAENADVDAVRGVVQSLLKGLRNSDIESLSKLFVAPGNDKSKMYAADLGNTSSRIGWVFFGAPRSLHSALSDPNVPVSTELFATYADGAVLACIQIGKSQDSFLPSVGYLLRGGSKFCFTVLHGNEILATDFLYR